MGAVGGSIRLTPAQFSQVMAPGNEVHMTVSVYSEQQAGNPTFKVPKNMKLITYTTAGSSLSKADSDWYFENTLQGRSSPDYSQVPQAYQAYMHTYNAGDMMEDVLIDDPDT